MPRIRQYAEKYAEQDQKNAEMAFWKNVKVRCVEQDIDTWTALGEQTGISKSSMRVYKSDAGKMQLGTMRTIIGVIKPDIPTLLQLLGYSEKEIRAFVKSYEN